MTHEKDHHCVECWYAGMRRILEHMITTNMSAAEALDNLDRLEGKQ